MTGWIARFCVIALLVAKLASATQTTLPSTFSLSSVTNYELTDLATTTVVTSAAESTRFLLLNLAVNNTRSSSAQITMRLDVDSSTVATQLVDVAPGNHTIQLPFTLTGLANGAHTIQVYITQSSSGPVNYTTNSYLGVYSDVLGGSGGSPVFDPQVANTVLAGPTTGADDVPTFRALVPADIPTNITVDNATNATTATTATTASALAANGTNCSTNQFAQGVSAAGNAEGCLVPPIADAFSSDPADCSAGLFANAIGANGALGCVQLVEADVQNLPIDLANLANTTNGAPGSYLSVGCSVTWSGTGLVFDVSACTYYIEGIQYTSPATQVTLTAADATNDRIDLIVVNTSSLADKITGTAEVNPAEPSFDPETQLKLVSISVPANATTPPSGSVLNVYLENTEWTCSPGSGFNCASTTNPRTGTKDIEATALANGVNLDLTNGSPIDPHSYDTLSLWIRSKAGWSGSSINLRLRLAGANKGSAVTIANGSYGFNAANTTTYQQIAVPVSAFAIPGGTLIDALRIHHNNSTAIGFYVDDVTFISSGVVGGNSGGTVTSVAMTVPGGFSITGSPITSSGTLALAANGTSGGIPYYSAATTMASSAALGANGVVVGGGAGVAPATSTNNTYDLTNFRQRYQNATASTDGSRHMWELDGTLPASPSADVSGINIAVTGAGSAAHQQLGGFVTLNAGYTGASTTTGWGMENDSASTCTALALNASNICGNVGAEAEAIGATTSGVRVGLFSEAEDSSRLNIGHFTKAVDNASGTNVALLANAANSAQGTNLKNVAGLFTLTTNDPATIATNGSFGVYVDSGTLPDANSAGIYVTGTIPNAGGNLTKIIGTLPTSPSAAVRGVYADITGAGSASFGQEGLRVDIESGYTGNTYSAGVIANNQSAGTGTSFNLGSTFSGALTKGIVGQAGLPGSGSRVGVEGEAQGSTETSAGVFGKAAAAVAGNNFGVLANAANSTEATDLKNVAVYATLNSSLITGSNISAGIISDNGSVAASPLQCYDNKVLIFDVADVSGTAVNGVRVTGGATTVAPIIAAIGETNIDLSVNAKGTGFILFNSPSISGAYTVATLPTCGSTRKGARTTITDANAACTFTTAPTGGGSTVCPVYCDGSAWLEG